MRTRAATVLAAALCLVAVASPSSAQTPDLPRTSDRAARAVALEAAQLLALGAFAPPTARLAQVIEPLGLADAPSVDVLIEADDAGAATLVNLQGFIPDLSADTRRALQPLGAADRAAAAAGTAISLNAEVYLRALDHLRLGDGSAPETAQPPDLAAISAWLATIDFEIPLQAPTGPPTSGPLTPTTTTPASGEPSTTTPATVADASDGSAEGSTDDDGGNGLPVGLVLAAIVAVALLGGLAVLWRRSANPRGAVDPNVDRLLEVSRRLTAAPADEVDRAIVREAVGLVGADGGALIHRRGASLHLGHESHAGLVVADGLAHGIVGRVAEAGQPVAQVITAEPAITSRPASLACVPLVGGGQVEAVLVVVRPADRPFSTDETAQLSAMAPVAAATLHRSRTAQAAIDDSLRDGLTGAGNRRRFDVELAATLAEGASLGETSALAIVDLDHFKAVNDAHGHQAGDAVLTQVVEVLRASVRPQDAVYRFGGEEFCILMAGTDLPTAMDVSERVRVQLQAHRFTGAAAGIGTQTASFGVAATADTGGQALVAKADAALYEAKGQGRNRVVSRA